MHYSEGWARQPVSNRKRTKNKTVAVLDTSVSVNLLRWWARRYFLNICLRVPELWRTVSKWCQGCVRVKISSTDSFLLCTWRVFPHRWHAIRIKVHLFSRWYFVCARSAVETRHFYYIFKWNIWLTVELFLHVYRRVGPEWLRADGRDQTSS